MLAKRVLLVRTSPWRFKSAGASENTALESPFFLSARNFHVGQNVLADAPKGCRPVDSKKAIEASTNVKAEAKKSGGGGGGGGESGGGCGQPPKDSLECHPARLQYSREVERGVNCQISAELEASYFYTSLASTFGRVDVALRGVEHFFWRAANQERNDAIRLADYQNKRGGIVSLCSIQDPGQVARTTCARDALTNSLQLQRNLTTRLLSLHKLANDHDDPVTCDFISEFFLMRQVKRMSRNGRFITQLCRVGDSGLALHDFDEWLYTTAHEHLIYGEHDNSPGHGHGSGSSTGRGSKESGEHDH